MWRHLQSTGKGFLPKAATEYAGSANDLLCTLRSMFDQLSCFRDACRPAEKYYQFEDAARQDARYQDPLRPHHKEQLAKNREISGLSQLFFIP